MVMLYDGEQETVGDGGRHGCFKNTKSAKDVLEDDYMSTGSVNHPVTVSCGTPLRLGNGYLSTTARS